MLPGTATTTEKKKFTTNYFNALLQYKQSKEYKEAIKTMQAHGMQLLFADHILVSAFIAGWGNQPIFEV